MIFTEFFFKSIHFILHSSIDTPFRSQMREISHLILLGFKPE